jgi:hypothetical protein
MCGFHAGGHETLWLGSTQAIALPACIHSARAGVYILSLNFKCDRTLARRRLAHAQAARAGAGDQVDDGTGHSGAVAPGIDVIASNNFRKSTPQPIVDALPVLPYGDACALHAALRARKSSSSDSDSCRHTTSGPAPPSGVASALQLEADGEVCPICLADSYSAATTVKLLPCGHFYHPCCIDEVRSQRRPTTTSTALTTGSGSCCRAKCSSSSMSSSRNRSCNPHHTTVTAAVAAALCCPPVLHARSGCHGM